MSGQKPHEFAWDDKKAASNLKKHGVSFAEAQTVFFDHRSLTIHDEDHSDQEDRFVTLGLSWSGRLIVVVHSDEDDRIRIISARKATRRESRTYGKQ